MPEMTMKGEKRKERNKTVRIKQEHFVCLAKDITKHCLLCLPTFSGFLYLSLSLAPIQSSFFLPSFLFSASRHQTMTWKACVLATY